ncbi:MAG TPA: hypothetical protein VIH86_12275 [Puia sp.]
MKKTLTSTLLVFLLISTMLCTSGCATIFGGSVDDCQRKKPAAGEPSRRVRVGALIADILLFTPSVIVDFATNAIYKPCGR